MGNFYIVLGYNMVSCMVVTWQEVCCYKFQYKFSFS